MDRDRARMVATHIRGRGVRDERVLAALETVQRHRFIPRELRVEAYRDHPLPIGRGQTVSQPFIVARMTELLGLQPGERVLEIGTGSGYQAAVLAEMGVQVYTMEIVAELAERATALLAELGYSNVSVRHGDGYAGWPEQAPFDAILLTAAPEEIPPPLLEQLAPGGRLCGPVGREHAVQHLVMVRRDSEGRLSRQVLDAVRFVPFTRTVR